MRLGLIKHDSIRLLRCVMMDGMAILRKYSRGAMTELIRVVKNMQPYEKLLIEFQEFQKLKEQCDFARTGKLLRKPVIIVSTPRSGSTLLFKILSRCTEFWNIGSESHIVYNAFPRLMAENSQLGSGRLTARHADKDTAHALRAGFLYFMQNSQENACLVCPESPDIYDCALWTSGNSMFILAVRIEGSIIGGES